MRRRHLLAATAAASLLAACSKEDDASSTKASGDKGGAAQPVSVEAIEQKGKGFSVGSTMAAHVIYVFFDAQCPHCAHLWEAAKPLKSQARFVWMPVGLIGEKSFSQGGAILAAPDPVAAMEQNESSVSKQQGGINAMSVTDAQKAVVKSNTDLFNSFGFTGVPTIVGKNAQSGQVVTVDGAVPAQTLAQRFGLSAPGG